MVAPTNGRERSAVSKPSVSGRDGARRLRSCSPWAREPFFEGTGLSPGPVGHSKRHAAHGAAQVGISETIDTSLTKRAEIEALNMADRQVDLAWQAEGPKIQSRLEAFNRNIARLTEAGGNGDDLALWRERYHLFQTAVSAIRDSYMPNAERKKEYLAIYRDITEHNNTLIAYIISVDSRERTKDHLEATLERPDRNGEIAAEARGRWKETSNRTNP